MKFRQLQLVKQRAYDAFASGTEMNVPKAEASQLDPISLAFVGDSYYALYMRRRLVHTRIPQVQVLHALAAEFVSARVQAYVYRQLKEMLTDTEQGVCKRARNAYSQVPKSATVAEYHDSTALEALVGYLVLSAQEMRLEEIMTAVYMYTKQYCQEKHGEAQQ